MTSDDLPLVRHSQTDNCKISIMIVRGEVGGGGGGSFPFSNNITKSVFPSQALDLESIKTHHWQITPCSAVTGERLLEGINWMTTDISSRIFTMD